MNYNKNKVFLTVVLYSGISWLMGNTADYTNNVLQTRIHIKKQRP